MTKFIYSFVIITNYVLNRFIKNTYNHVKLYIKQQLLFYHISLSFFDMAAISSAISSEESLI